VSAIPTVWRAITAIPVLGVVMNPAVAGEHKYDRSAQQQNGQTANQQFQCHVCTSRFPLTLPILRAQQALPAEISKE
jgi:hypothetical protein